MKRATNKNKRFFKNIKTPEFFDSSLPDSECEDLLCLGGAPPT